MCPILGTIWVADPSCKLANADKQRKYLSILISHSLFLSFSHPLFLPIFSQTSISFILPFSFILSFFLFYLFRSFSLSFTQSLCVSLILPSISIFYSLFLSISVSIIRFILIPPLSFHISLLTIAVFILFVYLSFYSCSVLRNLLPCCIVIFLSPPAPFYLHLSLHLVTLSRLPLLVSISSTV